jgi:hypothetical protein
VNQSQGTIKIREIQVSQWDGRIPGSESGNEDQNKDSIMFVNGDLVTGDLLNIANGETIFKTEYAELKIPNQTAQNRR